VSHKNLDLQTLRNIAAGSYVSNAGFFPAAMSAAQTMLATRVTDRPPLGVVQFFTVFSQRQNTASVGHDTLVSAVFFKFTTVYFKMFILMRLRDGRGCVRGWQRASDIVSASRVTVRPGVYLPSRTRSPRGLIRDGIRSRSGSVVDSRTPSWSA